MHQISKRTLKTKLASVYTHPLFLPIVGTMTSSRPKIILFSGDLAATDSPGQPSTNYAELGYDINTKKAAAKKFDAHDDTSAFHHHHQQHYQQAQPPQQPPHKPGPDYVNLQAFGQAYAIGSKHMSIAQYRRATKLMAYGAAAGIVLGAVLINWGSINEDSSISANVGRWIGLVGRLYLRAVFCIVLPMVLASMALSIAEIMRIGKGGRIAWRVMGYFLLTKVFAVCIGLAMALAFESQFTSLAVKAQPTPGLMYLRCGQSANTYVVASSTGAVSCENKTLENTAMATFVVKDTNNVFARNIDPNAVPSVKLAKSVLALTNDIIPDNVVRAMVSTNILSIATFAMIFGAAVCKNYRQNSTGTHYVMDILRQVHFVCELFAEWLLVLSPLPLCLLIASAAAMGQSNAQVNFASSCVYFVIAYLSAVAIYSGLVLPLLLYAATKTNPYVYLSAIVPAQVFAFSCSSSSATIPFTMRCVESSLQVSSSLNRFVVTLGAPLNKDGTAIYLPLAIVFLAKVSNITIDGASYPLILVLSILASVVTLPVPNAAPVTLYGIWAAVQSENFPAAVSFLTGIHWLMDRLTTVVNVTGDAVVARIVAHHVDEMAVSDSDTACQTLY
ncbi:hypothetical protein DYB36_003193 [Aphanomyces astaci]|uniref:Amino acid transporter n=1 Tax=Aphanomyces astaci TaxID=112090 RepID=A0A397B2Q6_APHAT|nr:hypothetical protein DYB36_003193 [Aphanomyces astaci]